jgi:hypothetical protein
MDSLACPTAFDLETVNENCATAVSKIMNETDSKGDAWIQKCSQPLLTQKKSMKTTFKGDAWIRQHSQPLLT